MNFFGKQIQKHRSLFAFVLAGCLLAVTHVAAEAKVIPKDVEQMAQEARWIFEGEVTDVRSEWSPDRTQIYTFVTITWQYLHKGTYGENAFQLRLLGGVVDGIAMTIPEGPGFLPGEHVILFLGSNPQAFFPIVGLSQGAFKVSIDPETGQEVVTNPAGISLIKSEFEDRVRRALGQ